MTEYLKTRKVVQRNICRNTLDIDFFKNKIFSAKLETFINKK